jgi:hypothetical protein
MPADFITANDVAVWLLQEALMGQKSEPPGFDQIYVLKIDQDGNTRGARFNMLKDSIVSAAMDMDCRVLIRQPESVSALGMKLPIGAVYGSGKLVTLFVPSITRGLYRRITRAATIAELKRDQSSFASHLSTKH